MKVLVPRNIEGRKEKLRQVRIRLLSQEVIEGDLFIDKTFKNIPLDLIKVKEIKGSVDLYNLGYIPSWLKDVKIYGGFTCMDNNLTSLMGCPKYIDEDFYCSYNNLTSLDGCPKYIGGDLYCYGNSIKLELPKGVELKGRFRNG